MVFEIAIVFLGIWMVFGDYLEAKARLWQEEAREKELANDEKEYGNGRSDEEGS